MNVNIIILKDILKDKIATQIFSIVLVVCFVNFVFR